MSMNLIVELYPCTVIFLFFFLPSFTLVPQIMGVIPIPSRRSVPAISASVRQKQRDKIQNRMESVVLGVNVDSIRELSLCVSVCIIES